MSESFKRIFQIDSHRRLSGSSSDFQFEIKLPPLTGATAEGLSVVLMAASIPKSYYVVPNGRNVFTLTENGVAIRLTVPPGNYDANNFMDAVLALMNAATLNGSVYSATLSLITGKYTFTVVGGPSSITCPATPIAGLQDQFGVDPAVVNTMPFTSPDVVRFASQTVLQIRTDLVSNGDNILEVAYAPQFADFSSVVTVQTDLDARSKPLATRNTSAPRFYICDEDEQPIDLNGQNVVFTIMIYRPLEYVLREFVKMKSIESMGNPHGTTERTLAKMLRMMKMSATAASAPDLQDEKEPVSKPEQVAVEPAMQAN